MPIKTRQIYYGGQFEKHNFGSQWLNYVTLIQPNQTVAKVLENHNYEFNSIGEYNTVIRKK